jgi:hypothetical protein
MKNPSRLRTERLESRTTPAALTGNVLTYTDVDGDLVRAVFTHAAMAPADFTFTTGGVDGTTDTPQALDTVNLTGKAGAGFRLTAAPQKVGGLPEGDSHANVRLVNGDNTDLGTIGVDGNVSFIFAGTGMAGTVGLKSLTALSLGLPSGTRSDTNGDLKNVGSVTVKGDVANVLYTFTGGLKKLSVGGNIVQSGGGDGGLLITGDLGTATIGGSIVGRFGGNPGLSVSGNVGALRIGGSVVGGDDDLAVAQVLIQGNATGVSVGGDLRGGRGKGTGSLRVLGIATTVNVRGDLIGGRGEGTGDVGVNGLGIPGVLRAIGVGGSLVGGTGDGSGLIAVGNRVTALNIGGSVLGGAGADSGEISLVGGAGAIKIGGSVLGGANRNTGLVAAAADIGSVSVGRNLQGIDYDGPATLTYEGTIYTTGNIGSVAIGGDFVSGRSEGPGSLAPTSGMIAANGVIRTVKIGGSIVGNPGHRAYITAGGSTAAGPTTAITSITVTGSVECASLLAGYTSSFAQRAINSGIGSVRIGGNLVGSYIIVGSNAGGDGLPGNQDDSAVSAVATIGSVRIGGAFTGLLGDGTTYYIYGPIVNAVSIGRAVYSHDALHGILLFNSIGIAVAQSVD